MENAKYIFTNDKNVMGSRKKQDPVVPIENIKEKNEDVDEESQDTMKERANYLTIGEQTISEDIIKLAKRRLFARKKILRDKYYKFIMQVAGFSNEPMIKLWKNETKKGEAPLTASDHSLAWETDWNPQSFRDILAEIQGDKTKLKEELDLTLQMKLKADFLNSAEITGQIFMTPNAYSHLLEAWEIIRHRCNVDIELEKLVDIEHSTYFARLVALRIQISRFLSGRYYTVSSNYKRLIRQQELLISGYFKSKFNANQCQPNQNPYLQQLQC